MDDINLIKLEKNLNQSFKKVLQTSCRFILRKYTSGIGILNQNVIKMASSENASVHDN